MFNQDQCFELGIVTKVHGLKGHVALFIDSDTPDNYFKMESVLLEIQGNLVPFFIENIQRLKPNVFKVGFEDITSVEAASDLVKKKAFLPLNQLPDLPDDQFYFHEIGGFELWNDGALAGIINQVIDNPGNPLFEVTTTEGNEVLIPIQDHFIHKLHKKDKKIEMNLPEGLLDL